MDMSVDTTYFQQHLIDPEICIRCNTCEVSCPIDAITHDSLNYVVKAEVCNGCMACISPCPTGAIDSWRTMPRQQAYAIDAQLKWESLPAELSSDQLSVLAAQVVSGVVAANDAVVSAASSVAPTAFGAGDASVATTPVLTSHLPPWSAAHPYTNLYGQKAPVQATVVGNFNCTEAGFANETHHIVLDFGALPFPVLEGQSIGIIPPGRDAHGRPYVARQYSIASPRNGERPGYNNLSLTVKRVTEDHSAKPVKGVASNYLCDAKIGDKVQVIGPFGSTFLMPNHPKSNILMICTGTGSAPMRAMTEWRRRLRQSGKFEGGHLLLFFGARTQQELPYFGPLMNLPKDFIDVNFAFSRAQGQPKRYVQDAMRERAADVAQLLNDGQTYIYVCGLKSMEEGVVLALREIAEEAGLSWDNLSQNLRAEGRLHLETY